MKCILLGNQARAMVNFWTVLLRSLVSQGHEVVCLTPEPAPEDDPQWEEALRSLGVRLLHYPLDRKGLNPLTDFRTLLALRRILRAEAPDRLFCYTIKPVIYGSLASALSGRPARSGRFAMITGLGYMFEGGSPLKRLLTQVARLLYRLAFSCCGAVFFQNEDDKRLFEKLSIIPRKLSVYSSRGTGVDTRHFAAMPLPEGPPVFLFMGRLLEAKGLRDFIEAARLIRAEHPEALFRVLGPAEKGPGAVPLDEVLTAQKLGLIEYLGESRDVRPHLAAARAVVLPSWREGTPCALLEAMSTARAVIAADAPGSREVLRPGENGLLTPVRDAQALAMAVKQLIMDKDLARVMGERGRAMAEADFSAEAVAQALLLHMRLL